MTSSAPLPWKRFCASALLLGGAALAMPCGEMHRLGNVPVFLGAMGLMSAGFLLSLCDGPLGMIWFWAVAAVARLLLLCMAPGDDLYRYIWEGHIQNFGFNPYVHAPNSAVLQGLHDEVWQRIEHKTVSAIYPPLAELGFRLLARVSHSALWFKAAFVVADGIVCALLARRFGTQRAVLYAWNPLILYSFAGGGHYDSWFVLCLVAAWLTLGTPPAKPRAGDAGGRRWLPAVAWLGAGVAVKWVCLPLLAWVIWRAAREQDWKRGLVVAAAGAVPFLAAWALVCGGAWDRRLMAGDFAFHAHSAEAVPALVVRLWPSLAYHNEIYLAPLAVVCLLLLWRVQRFSTLAGLYFFSLYLLSPLIHAWYFTWIIPFAVVSRNRGVIAVSISAFAYFWVYHTAALPDGKWNATLLEMILMWAPFVIGFILTPRKTHGTPPDHLPDA